MTNNFVQVIIEKYDFRRQRVSSVKHLLRNKQFTFLNEFSTIVTSKSFFEMSMDNIVTFPVFVTAVMKTFQ